MKGIGYAISKKCIHHGLKRFVQLFGFDVDWHGGMHCFDSEILMNMRMKDGDIAETNDPFGMLAKRREIEAVDDANGSISAAGTDNGPDPGIIEHLLKIFSPLIVGSGKLVMFSENIGSENNFESVPLEESDGGMHLFEGNAAGRRNNADFIALFQIRRLDHGSKIHKIPVCLQGEGENVSGYVGPVAGRSKEG